jgi:hypothetical protein
MRRRIQLVSLAVIATGAMVLLGNPRPAGAAVVGDCDNFGYCAAACPTPEEVINYCVAEAIARECTLQGGGCGLHGMCEPPTRWVHCHGDAT